MRATELVDFLVKEGFELTSSDIDEICESSEVVEESSSSNHEPVFSENGRRY